MDDWNAMENQKLFSKTGSMENKPLYQSLDYNCPIAAE
jgi:hypothetical protein